MIKLNLSFQGIASWPAIGATNKMQVEMDLCTICNIEGINYEADAPDGTIRIGRNLERRFERVAS